MVAHGQHMGAGFIAVDFHVVAHAVRREQPHHAARVEGFLCAQPVEHVVSIFKQALRLFAHHLIFKNARIFARQRPGHEERRPVDVVTQRFDAGRHVLHAQTVCDRRRIAGPVERQIVFARRLKRNRRRARFLTSMLNADGFILFAGAGDKVIALGVGQQRGDHAHGARGVLNIHRRPTVVLLDFHRRVGFRGGCPANQQWNGKALALHLFCHVDHFVQRRRNQPGKTNQIRIHFARGPEDFIRRDHHAKIDNFVVITLQHHANDVFADVVYVALHGGDDHFTVTGALLFAGFDKGFQIRHRLFHDAGGFHHLRQEHFALAKQIADHVHAVHQRPFDHFNRTGGLLTRFLGILLDKLGNAFYQRVFQTLIHIPGAPFGLLNVG